MLGEFASAHGIVAVPRHGSSGGCAGRWRSSRFSWLGSGEPGLETIPMTQAEPRRAHRVSTIERIAIGGSGDGRGRGRCGPGGGWFAEGRLGRQRRRLVCSEWRSGKRPIGKAGCTERRRWSLRRLFFQLALDTALVVRCGSSGTRSGYRRRLGLFCRLWCHGQEGLCSSLMCGLGWGGRGAQGGRREGSSRRRGSCQLAFWGDRRAPGLVARGQGHIFRHGVVENNNGA